MPFHKENASLLLHSITNMFKHMLFLYHDSQVPIASPAETKMFDQCKDKITQDTENTSLCTNYQALLKSVRDTEEHSSTHARYETVVALPDARVVGVRINTDINVARAYITAINFLDKNPKYFEFVFFTFKEMFRAMFRLCDTKLSTCRKFYYANAFANTDIHSLHVLVHNIVRGRYRMFDKITHDAHLCTYHRLNETAQFIFLIHNVMIDKKDVNSIKLDLQPIYLLYTSNRHELKQL